MTRKMNGLTIKPNTNTSTTFDLTASVEKKILAANQNYKVYTEHVEEDIYNDETEELQEYYDEQFESYDNENEE